jgi:hypothetical protein
LLKYLEVITAQGLLELINILGAKIEAAPHSSRRRTRATERR